MTRGPIGAGVPSRAGVTRGAPVLGAILLMAMSIGATPPAPGGPASHALRVCADPNNMPFSDRAGEGFENRIASLLARDMGATPVYTWWAQRRGFIRTTLGAHECDVIVGIAADAENVLTTPPYYRSTYVFVTRRDRHLDISSFDDPRLRTLRVGLHVIGADYNSLPPGVALATRGIVHNIVGYSIYGNYAKPSPPSALIAAVAKGDVDVAIAWGPLAGYYAKQSAVPLAITPVSTPDAGHGIPFAYDIAIGVRRDDRALADTLSGVLVRRHADIERILREYGVPMAGAMPPRGAPAAHRSAARLGVSLTCISNTEEARCA
jgi:mxaJ protein